MIVVKSPLRVSFFGGGSDIEKFYRRVYGRVLSSTIDTSISIVVNRSSLPRVKLIYSEIEIAESADQLKHDRARAVLKHFGIERGIDIASFADVSTKGTGLGSSSAYTVGLIKALSEYKNRPMTKHEIANLACKIEIEDCAQPIGKQDQYASTFGGFNQFTFHSDGQVEVQPIDISYSTMLQLQYSLMLYDTGQSRATGDVLRKFNPDDDNIAFGSVQESLALVDEGLFYLRNGQLDKFGHLLDQGWKLKKKMTGGVSNTFLDKAYETAIKSGAYGGKLLGAGGGGYFLFYVNGDHVKFDQAMKKIGLKYVPLDFSTEGVTTLFKE